MELLVQWNCVPVYFSQLLIGLIEVYKGFVTEFGMKIVDKDWIYFLINET